MHRIFAILPLGVLFTLLVCGEPARSQPGADFGVLTTKSGNGSASLPTGIQPVRQPTQGPATVNNPYPLSAEAGPWLICAATYLGPSGAELAQQVANQLRGKHKLTAYIYNRGDEERRKQNEDWEALKARYPGVAVKKRVYRVQDQYAVLVGGFADFQAAAAFLPRIKALPLPELRLQDSDKSPYDVQTYHEPDPDKKTMVMKQAYVNPFHNALVVRNPLLPGAQAGNRPKWDPFWKQLNADEEYSLLRNPKPWTLMVKEFMGGRTIQPQKSKESSFLSALGFGSGSSVNALDASAAQARELAIFLRKTFKLEAYVLHTRYSSVVFVGGFTSADDPALVSMQRQIGQMKFNSKSDNSDPIGLLPNPVPVEVPRF